MWSAMPASQRWWAHSQPRCKDNAPTVAMSLVSHAQRRGMLCCCAVQCDGTVLCRLHRANGMGRNTRIRRRSRFTRYSSRGEVEIKLVTLWQGNSSCCKSSLCIRSVSSACTEASPASAVAQSATPTRWLPQVPVHLHPHYHTRRSHPAAPLSLRPASVCSGAARHTAA